MIEEIISFMNQAERRYADPQHKEDFVIRCVLQLYPDMKVEEIKFSIGVLISVSKLSTKILFNLPTKCCNIS